MQCGSYTPVYYHNLRDLNGGAGGYSWHLYNSNASYREERGHNNSVFVPSCDQYLGHDKEMLKQIIQNQEAAFRSQVQELHRVYRRQRDLMNEMRAREIFGQHLLSQTSESIHSSSHGGDEIPQKPSPATGWLFGNLSPRELSELASGDCQGPKSLVAENFLKHSTLQSESGIRRNSSDDAKFLFPGTKQSGIIDLELPARIYHDDQVKQFKAGNLSEASDFTCRTPDKVSNFLAATHLDIGMSKTWDLSSSSSDTKKTYCFIDLNEPIQLESLPTNSSGPLEAFTALMKTGENSDGTNSSMDIDLNSMPFESPPSINREVKVVPDSNSASEDEPIVQNSISDSFLKTESYIDLNSSVVDEHPLPPSSSKSAELLKGPVSPENKERSPPRGESEDIQLETHLLSEQGEAEPFIESDTTAAKTLVKIYSSGVGVEAEVLDSLANFRNLCWFAEIVSSNGDEVGDEVMELETDAMDQGGENALSLSRFSKEKGTSNMSRRSGKGQKRGKKQCKGFKPEALETGSLKRRPGRSGGAKARKYSKLSPSDVTKKSMSSIMKQSIASGDQSVKQSWGRTKKRQGGRRHRASQLFLVS
ncbi:uncharacterized protein LOC121753358 [Salvia splendens]|uniref:uncharacterized protein LOC121753358 n=1 Tax=Salvia splendens TaxID=180675 RepID=UPI001C27CBBD|nr:uncharacterized protein LOC121753358 [Salvia splendens]XP_042004575.1 uncharacterized protein LOC121753358 [Salvia splendens]